MTDLRLAGSRALLIGTGCPTGGVGAIGLLPVHSVRRTLLDLRSTLVSRCGLDADHVQVLLDPAMPFEVGEALARETEQAEGVLLIYYAGHGLVSLDGELYLATGTTDTRPGYLTHTAVAYAQVRNAVLDSPARIKVVMLDCCYSGRAFATLGDSVGADAIALCRVHGGYVLTATGANESAFAPPGEPHTVFGGELIRLLTEGDQDGPPLLTLQHTYLYLQTALQARGFPRPR
jgi:Caspase domain